MRFVFDACISWRLAKALEVLEQDTVHLTAILQGMNEALPGKLQDDIWLCWLHPDDFGITLDANIGKSYEKKTVIARKVGLFKLTHKMGNKHMSGLQLAEYVIHHWEAIKEAARTRERPFMLRVPLRGTKFENLL